MERKNYKTACALFRESYQLDPVPGALHALAVCHVEAGEVASAVMRLDEYLRIFEKLPPAQRAKHAQRAKSAREQRAALAPQVPELTLVLPAHVPPGTRILQDSIELSAAAQGVALPIDPGEHMVTTQVPGGLPIEHRFTIRIAEKKRLELTIAKFTSLFELPEEPASRDRNKHVIPVANAQKEQNTRPVSDQHVAALDAGNGLSGYRIGAYVAGSVGAAALVVGIVAGTLVLGKKSVIDENCIDTKCTQGGLIAARAAADSAQLPGAISTAGFAIGTTGLVGGAVLFLLEPSDKLQGTHRSLRMGLIDIGLTSTGPFEWSAGIKGAW